MRYSKILIAVDDSPTAQKVATTGLQLGQRLNSELALVSVVDTTALMTDGGITPGELAAIIKDDYRKSQQKLIDTVFKDVTVQAHIEEGKPHQEILKLATEWQADLVVIGTHGRTGLSHLLLGSVAEHVVRHASIPVLIVPSK